MRNIHIIHTKQDQLWAEWITWVLQEKGFTVNQDPELEPGEDWAKAIQREVLSGSFIVLLSEHFFRSRWVESFDIAANKHSIFPIRVEEYNLTGDLAELKYLDLVGKTETEAEHAILDIFDISKNSPSSNLLAIADVGSKEGIKVSQGYLKIERRSQSVRYFFEKLTDDFNIEMMLIPAGTFWMGSPDQEVDRQSWEGPQHEVSVDAFCMAKYPVTQAQWRFVTTLPQVEREIKPDPSRFKGDNRPVEKVSWYDAVEFCARLTVYTNRQYRLPSEAEWEYACRAGTTTPFHFGETITTDLANYDGTDDKGGKWSGSYGRGPKGDYRQETTPVNHFGIANAFGLCDMHGNVWEWCQDHWHGGYEGKPEEIKRNGNVPWVSEDQGAGRVIRGGSWSSYPRHCRSAYRNNILSLPVNTYDLIGFRLVCSAPRTL